MNDLQLCLKSLLFRIVDLFEKNNINYWLAFGSALGAARHFGFIPWDDDIDIYVDGKDYDKIKSVIEQNKDFNLDFHDFEIEDYPFTFPKIIDNRTTLVEKRFENTSYKSGVYIDVFPLFSVSNNAFVRYIQSRKRYFNYCIVESNTIKNNTDTSIFRKIISKFFLLFDKTNAQKRTLKEIKKGIQKSRYLMHPIRFSNKKIHYTNNFKSYDLLTFEGKKMRVHFHYKTYLEQQYGDYLKMPPKERRISEHNFVRIVIPDEAKY